MNPVILEGALPGLIGLLLTSTFVLALLSLPLPRGPFLGARLMLLILTQATLAAAAALTLTSLLEAGGFAALDIGGWQGAVLHAGDPLGLVPLSIGPMAAAVWLAVSLAGLVAILTTIPHAFVVGTAAPAGLIVLSTISVVVLVGAESLAAVCASFAGTSVLGAGAFAALRPPRTAVTGIFRLALLHRLGDAALCLAVFVVGPELMGLETRQLLEHAVVLEPWTRLSTGVFAGWAPRELWQLAAFLVVIAASTRLLTVPLFLAARDAIGDAGGIVGFVHGVTSLACGGLLLLRLSALLSLAPEALQVLGVAAAATLGSAALLAVAARDLRRIDLLLLVGFQAIATLLLAALDRSGALLAELVLLLACVPLCASGTHVISASRASDPRKLGGLERLIPRTHTTRLLATGALVGPAFAGAFAVVHATASTWLAPWLGGAVAVAVLCAVPLLSLAAFRALHLTFTGKSARSELGPMRDPALISSIPAIALALGALGLGLLFIPQGILAWLPLETTYAAPLAGFVAQDVLQEAPVRAHVLPGLVAPPLLPGQLAALAIAAMSLGWILSLVLFRGGPRAPLAALVNRAGVSRVLSVLDAVAGSDVATRDVGERAVALSRLIAVNLAPAFLETALRRVPALLSLIASATVRMFSSGSAQRGALFVVSAAALLLWWWGRA